MEENVREKLTCLIIIASLITLISFMAGCAPQEHEVEGQAELEEAGEMINETIVNYKTAYFQGDLEEANKYLGSR